MASASVSVFRRWHERFVEGALFLSALSSVAITLGIAAVLLIETLPFFHRVPIWRFLTDTQWTPLFEEKHFGIGVLLCGTLLTTIVALIVALPVGLISAVYLSEYAPPRFRAFAKPALEILAAVPTVVYGYFALVVVTPFLQKFIPNLAGFNSLSPGIVMGVMIIPLVSSLSEDALRMVPMALREGALALGATRFQVAFHIVAPAAFSGIASAFILGMSRAIGETMIVAIAAGQQPNLTLNPLVPIETITAYIVQVSLGDTPQGTLEYQTIFAAGMTLFVFIFIFNVISFRLRQRFREAYE
ncbi:MAG: phosphate ABC transporter permease subunit PstC [bacterium JZ-2024 1]